MKAEVDHADLEIALGQFPQYLTLNPKERAAFDRLIHSKVEAERANALKVPTHFKLTWAPAQKIMAIKLHRTITGSGLKEAKDAVEANQWDPIPSHMTLSQLCDTVREGGLTVAVEHRGATRIPTTTISDSDLASILHPDHAKFT